MSGKNFPSSGFFGEVALLLDGQARQSLRRIESMPANVKRAIALSKARGISHDELLELCDSTTTHPELPGMVFPKLAIYHDGIIRAYIPTEYAKPTINSPYPPAPQAANVDETRQDTPRRTMPRRSSSMINHRGSHPNMRSLYTEEELAAARKRGEERQKQEASKTAPPATPNLARTSSRQSETKKGARRGSQSSSLASSQSAEHTPQRRTSVAYSNTSSSASSSKPMLAQKR